MIPCGHKKQLDMPLGLLGSGNQKLEPRIVAGFPRPNRNVDPQTCLGAGRELKRPQARQLVLCWSESPDVLIASMSGKELSQVLADDHVWLGFRHMRGPQRLTAEF